MSEASTTAEVVENPTDPGQPENPQQKADDTAEYKAYKAGQVVHPAEDPKPEGDPKPEPEKPVQEEPKPWRNKLPPERMERMIRSRDARIQELEAEVQRSKTPTSEGGTAEPDPYDAKYQRADGSFDSQKYMRDNNAWVAENAVKTFEQRQAEARTRQEQEAAQKAEIEAMQTATTSFTEKLEQHKAADPELGEKVAWFAENFAQAVPERVARELLHSDPRVIGILADHKELLAQALNGDVVDTVKMIGVIEDRLLGVAAPPSTQSAAPQKPEAHRNPQGQFAPKAPPPIPSELPTRGGGSQSGLFSDDYRTFKKARNELRG